MIALALLLNAAGFLCLAAAGKRTGADLLGRPVPAAPVRRSGSALIAASGAIACCSVGAATALVLLAGLSTIGAAVAVAAVTLRRPVRER